MRIRSAEETLLSSDIVVLIMELASRRNSERAERCLHKLFSSADRFALTPAILIHPSAVRALTSRRRKAASFAECLELGSVVLKALSRLVPLEVIELSVSHMEKAVEVAYWDDLPYAYALDVVAAEEENLPLTLPCFGGKCEEWLVRVCKDHGIRCVEIPC